MILGDKDMQRYNDRYTRKRQNQGQKNVTTQMQKDRERNRQNNEKI